MRSASCFRQLSRHVRRNPIQPRRPRLERLEDRAVPSRSADVFNVGDIYLRNGEAIPLDRRADLVTVRIDGPDAANIVSTLISSRGPLNGFRILRKLDANEWMLSCPPSSPFGPNLAFSDSGDQRLVAVAGMSGVSWVAPVFHNPETNSWMAATDEIIVALQPGINSATFFNGERRFSTYRRLDGTPDQFVATLSEGSGASTLSMSEELMNDARVAWAEPNFWQDWQRFLLPNDEFFSLQWHLNNTANDADVDAAEAWDIIQGGSSNITVAIVDDGIEISHPDLEPNIFVNTAEKNGTAGVDDDGNGWIDDVNGWDFTGNDNDPGPTDGDDEHGTATAGVAAGVGNNAIGIAGAAYKSRILPARIFDGPVATNDANIASAIYYSAGRTANGASQWNAANITSNSWGGGSLTQALIDCFTWASNSAKGGQGVPSFIASGNGGTSTVSSPAILSGTIAGVIAVGASTNSDVRSSYSQYGPQLDFLAPSNGGSLGITTTDRTGANGYSSTDYTSGFGGTSSATPLAAGVGALVLAIDPTLTSSQVRGLLRNTTDYIGPIAYSSNLGFNTQYGYGRVNARTAVEGVGKAEIQVLDIITNIADGASTVDFGSVSVGGSVSRTFRIRNQGTLPLNLSNLSVPAPFSILTNFGDTTLSVGEVTTFVVQFAPTAGGQVSQTLSFTNNDANEGSFDFTVRGTGLIPNISGRVYEDWNANGTRDAGDPGIANVTTYLDLNSNSILDPLSAQNATDIPKSILDNATASSTMSVSGIVGTLSDVNVKLSITHTYDADLTITLISPTGKQIILANGVGSGGNNFTNTVFDDQATTSITAGAAPFTGSFQPDQPLSVLNGIDPNGIWTLNVFDGFDVDTGTLDSWSLTFNNGFGEPNAVTGATGDYAYLNLAAGTYNVRRLVPAGYSGTGASVHVVNLPSPSTSVTGQDFGLVRQNAIYGRVFNDQNLNGVDDSEPPLVGWTVFDDANNNGTIDSGSSTVTSTNVPIAIPDNGTTTSTLTINGAGAITDINVQLSITHKQDSNLDVFLISPLGTKVELFTDVGGSGDNFTNTILDDEAAVAITSGSAPFTGTFRPEGKLSDFDGQIPNGTWTLSVTDDAVVTTGTLTAWKIIFTSSEQKVTTDSNGSYVLSNLSAGNHNVRTVLQGGYTATAPAGGVHVVNVVSGQTYNGRDFGANNNPNPPFAVTIEQAAGQPDPSNGGTIHFKAVFDKAVADFINTDVVIGGTAGATTALVTGGGTTYDIAVSGMTQTGTVTVNIPAGVATNGASSNEAATIIDNSVLFDATAPGASVGALPNITTTVATPYSFTVTFTDQTAVSVASIASGDVRVTGPNGFDVPANLTGVDIGADGTPRVATFSINAPVSGWSANNNGNYTVALQGGAVADTAGNTTAGASLGTFNVTIAPTVVDFKVNDDGDKQRSQVRSLIVTFSDVVVLPATPADAFSLVRTGPGTPNTNVDLSIDTVTLSTPTQTIARITFSGALTENVGSLIDGRYDFTIIAGQVTTGGVTLDGDGIGGAGGNYVNDVHRLFGDSDGDAAVTADDFAAFRGVFGLSGPSYFDNTADNNVGADDFADFRERFGINLGP